MAQKAAKSLATRNATLLKKLHAIALSIHVTFLALRLVLFRNLSSRSLGIYVVLSSPAALIEFVFERNSRPRYNATGDLVGAGDDLEAKGLTEYMFDVMYWSWGNIIMASIIGDRAWWLWTVIPAYSLYAVWKAYGGMQKTMSGLAGAAGQGGERAQSNRQNKFEKRGAQKVQYR